MCGIAGVFGAREPATVSTMLARLLHRGPDEGHQVDGPGFSMGARRLSIVDVAGGRQPLCNETGEIWAAQNGELYNYPEHRPGLLARGHVLTTRCDTELLPHLYEEVGADLPKSLDGMFAIAVWDVRTRTGLLARDRMGKKPLYYVQHDGALYFASEIKSLLAIPGFQPKVNLCALEAFLGLKHSPAPDTFFQGIHLLPPAHQLLFSRDGQIVIRPYWRVDFSPDPKLASLPEAEIVDLLLQTLRRAMQRRLMADVPIGFFLSGGIDSSLSTALAAEHCGRVSTFTLTYSHESSHAGKNEDRHWARWVADRYATDHHEETIEFSNFPNSLRSIIQCFDEPFAGVVSTWFLARRIAQHVKVAIAGDGADELFGSYRSHRLAQPLAHFSEFRATRNLDLIRPFEQDVQALQHLASQPSPWRASLDVFTDPEKTRLFSPDLRKAVQSRGSAYWAGLLAKGTATDPLNRILEAEFLSVLPDQVLAFVDRLSMAHSLEVRSAFLDTDVVKLVASLPGHFKIRDGETKYLLKQAARRYFPEPMVSRPKEGFIMPVTQWLLQDLQDYVRETLSPIRLAAHGLFDLDEVNRLVSRLYDGHACHYSEVNRVYTLIVFQEWYEQYRPSISFATGVSGRNAA